MSTKENTHPSVKISKNAWAQSPKIGAEWNTLIGRSEGALSPSMNGAAVVESFAKGPFGEVDLVAAISTLNEQIDEIRRGDMSGPEAILYAQVNALQSIFVNLARRANSQEYLRQFEAYMTFALKAQAQCRATLEALNEIKFPKSATFVKQANIANQQQVNNGISPRAEKTANPANELLPEANHGALDAGATEATGHSHPTMEAVGEIHRPKNQQGKKAERAECP